VPNSSSTEEKVLKDEELDALGEGTFRLDCLAMQLRERKTKAPREYKGAGLIEQNEAGGLVLRLTAPEARPTAPQLGVPGQLIAEEEYWSLTATDLSGRRWEASHMIPHEHWAAGGLGCVVTGDVYELVSVEPVVALATHERLELNVFDDLGLPYTGHTRTTVETGARNAYRVERNRTELSDEDLGLPFSLHVESSDGRTRLRARGESLPPRLNLRVVEALQFVTGRPIQGGVERVVSGATERTVIRGELTRSNSRGVEPPVPTEIADARNDFWRLFSAYLRYVNAWPSDEFHPLSTEWDSLVKLGSAGLETRALVLAVAVEAVLRIVEAEAPTTPAPLTGSNLITAEWVERIDTFLEREQCPMRVRKRIRGFFKPLFDVSPSNRLTWLAERGALDTEVLPSRGKLRNTRAHGSKDGLRTPDEIVAACDAVLGLLYQLAFHAVGYSGTFTNYGKLGWPAERYPLTSKHASGDGPAVEDTRFRESPE
jgi:hypothetical protein